MVELNKLPSTPCENEILCRASLFSALTGLRLSDIQKLRWKEISIENGQAKLNFTQKKTKGVEYMPISEQALQLCGEEKSPDALVFEGLPDSSWISRPLRKWLQKSGIQKHITFHVARHREFYKHKIINRLNCLLMKVGNDMETSELLYSTLFCHFKEPLCLLQR